MTRVGGTTQVYAVLGDPVDHSLSPRIQNAAFQALGIDAVYVALRVAARVLDAALAGLHAAGLRGLNLTLPLKEAAYRLARTPGGATAWSGVSPEAEEAGAINTLRWGSNGWSGHATDGAGFMKWVDEEGVDPTNGRILVLGAGGAARAIATSLLRTTRPESLHIVSRSAEHADSLRRTVEGGFPHVTSAAIAAPVGAGGWQVIIRALSVEAVSDAEERWWRGHDKGAIVFDLNYGARSERARRMAEACGLRYVDGGPLLVRQGAESFEFWTGRSSSDVIGIMRSALAEAG